MRPVLRSLTLFLSITKLELFRTMIAIYRRRNKINLYFLNSTPNITHPTVTTHLVLSQVFRLSSFLISLSIKIYIYMCVWKNYTASFTESIGFFWSQFLNVGDHDAVIVYVRCPLHTVKVVWT